MADSDKSGTLHRMLSLTPSSLRLMVIIMLSLIVGVQATQAQDDSEDESQAQSIVIVTGSDASEFPIVRLSVIAVDGEGNRLEILTGLAVIEDGEPVEVLDIGETITGVEYFFVLDANETYNDQDQPSGLTRREMVRDSIVDFASNIMNQAQMDRVSILIPGEEGVATLVDRSQFHTEVINEINFYEPDELAETPLNEMLSQALDRAGESGPEGRAQVIVLFTDAGDLDNQLDFEALTAKAQELSVPIYSVILGARADESEIANVALLADPTGGSYIHLEEVASASPLFAQLENNGRQHLIEYRSGATSAGDYPVTVETAGGVGSIDVNVDVAPARVEMAVDNSLPIRRVLDSADAPIAEAEPASQPIVARVSWPDGHPRSVSEVVLLVDGVEQTLLENPELTDENLLSIDWDLTNIDEGSYALVVRTIDELGIVGESEELPMNIEVARPAAPVETEVAVQPTAVAAEPESEESANLLDNLGVVGIVVGAASLLALFFVVIVAIVLLRRRKLSPAPVAAPVVASDSGDATQVMMPSFAAPKAPTAFLEPLENAPEHGGMIAISGDSIAIGRDENMAQIVFKSKSVSRLHARIMVRGNVYQLYDEGSASGTYVNYEQVSLTPQNIQDMDDIHFGQVHLRFHVSGAGPEDDSTQIMQAPSRPAAAPPPVSDDMNTEPFMPNQPPAPGQQAAPEDDEDDTSTQPYMPHSPRR